MNKLNFKKKKLSRESIKCTRFKARLNKILKQTQTCQGFFHWFMNIKSLYQQK